MGDELGLQETRVGGHGNSLVILLCPKGCRDKIGKALTDTGSGFDGKPAVVGEREFDAAGHFQLLGSVFVTGENAAQRAIRLEVVFGGVHVAWLTTDGHGRTGIPLPGAFFVVPLCHCGECLFCFLALGAGDIIGTDKGLVEVVHRVEVIDVVLLGFGEETGIDEVEDDGAEVVGGLDAP